MKRGMLILALTTALACALMLRFAQHIPDDVVMPGTVFASPCPADWVLMYDSEAKDEGLRCRTPSEARKILKAREK